MDWALDAERRNPDPMVQYILAKLYAKPGDKNKTKEYAEKSLQSIQKSKLKDPDFLREVQQLINESTKNP
ncbi:MULTISPECIES: hypothetical protein [Chryseobacterium]|uniref:Tetratricopeptide repeat protein n=1 Tax=Chryseobacterium geocarposphaerae TaxID=1416776 RepID=A0ABU1LBF1_9FLAO|nr:MULTISPECIES: hypothetical protein [Chryseobacterium]MDR6404050.1 hypothetical protein [Chryseobacterium geocarposphaerae]MDR6698431.1 hypothetical protein [Chryseobacterium ginsenosidimutans]